MRLQGILPNQLTPLDRLAYVGINGMGALIYEPDYSVVNTFDKINLDYLALHAKHTDLIALGLRAKLNNKTIKLILDQTNDAINQWPTLAKKYGVDKENNKMIGDLLGFNK